MTFFINNIQFSEGKRQAMEHAQTLRITDAQMDTFYVGYRQLMPEEVNKYTLNNPPPRPYPYEAQINITVEMRAFEASCNHMSPDSVSWSTSGCIVSG